MAPDEAQVLVDAAEEDAAERYVRLRELDLEGIVGEAWEQAQSRARLEARLEMDRRLSRAPKFDLDL